MATNLSDNNRRILLKAYDDGEGGGIIIVTDEDPQWFVGMYEDSEIFQGVEHDGVLYTIVHASEDGLVSVVVGRGLLKNVTGAVFHDVNEAKTYIQGCLEA